MKTILNVKQVPGYLLTLALLFFGFIRNANAQSETGETFKGKIGKTFSESQEWWPAKVHAKKGAPNVVLFLIDDAGYGTSSAFGGLMQTPTLDSLANNGLRYTNPTLYQIFLCIDLYIFYQPGAGHEWPRLQSIKRRDHQD